MITTLTRGERNNNPGNIDYHEEIQWLGQVGIEIVPLGEHYEPRFIRFKLPVYGLRAIAKELISYIHKDGCNTVAKIVMRWAPPSENDTAAYIKHVAEAVDCAADHPLQSDSKTLEALTKAIITHENMRCEYPDDLIARAVQMALGLA